MNVVRVLGTLEPGGAQLSVLRLTVALRRQGIATTLLAGDANPAGLEIAARYGVPARAYRVSEVVPACSLQWTPRPEFADWLAPRLSEADVVHAHMFGAWWAAAQVVPAHVPLVASEHNQITWPGEDHTPQARSAGRRVDLFFSHGPAARAWAARIGMDDGRLRDGRSSVEGLDAEPLPGLPSPRVTFAGRFRSDKAPDALVEALALLDSPPREGSSLAQPFTRCPRARSRGRNPRFSRWASAYPSSARPSTAWPSPWPAAAASSSRPATRTPWPRRCRGSWPASALTLAQAGRMRASSPRAPRPRCTPALIASCWPAPRSASRAPDRGGSGASAGQITRSSARWLAGHP